MKVPDGKENETSRIVDDILAGIATDGVTAEELGKVRENALRDNNEAETDNSYWLAVLKVFDRDGVDYPAEYTDAFRALTPEAIRKFASESILPSSRMKIIMTPATSAESSAN